MAEGRAEADKNIVCRFFATTGCREGNKCAFPHDKPDSRCVLDSVCRFYLVGKCIYGATCRFSHTRPASPASSSQACSAITNANSNAKYISLSKNYQQSGATNITPTQTNTCISSSSKNRDWVNAPEFVPQVRKSYADVLKPEESYCKRDTKRGQNSLCPYFEVGECPSGDQCCFVHGDMCDLCGKACLLPFDKEQQKKHHELCEQELVKDMELSFAVQRSADKTCGICMDVIMEKEGGVSNRRFGILEKCNHIFCLPCIRKWREVKRTEAQTADNLSPNMTRACPECRVPSDFITPSQYWVDNESEKKKLINDYKKAMGKKPCKYFDEGRGSCPFAGACFYLHAYPDGTIVKLGPPKPRRRRNQNGDIDTMDHVMLWDFLESRDENGIMMMNNIDWDNLTFDFTDSDDSDFSDSVW